ncbi:MAG: hypothetical protein K2X47_16960 [Bdellovibrionales bacterium]|nr:hypothetical protein [Bdellovibrionales bacterium]
MKAVRSVQLSLKKAQQVMQIFFVTLVFIVGAVTALTVSDSGVATHDGEIPGETFRGPASLSANFEPKSLRKEIEVVKLSCEENSYHISAVSQIRLSGKVCQNKIPKDSVKSYRIKNLSTNTEAMVFRLDKADHFTTDLIPVQAGANHIEISNDFEDGHTESHRIEVTAK